MKVMICLLVLGCVAGALCDNKKKPPVDLKWHAPEPKPLKDWHAKPANPHSGVNLGVEKKHTIYNNGNLKVEGVAGANRDFGGRTDGRWNAKAGTRLEYAWGKRN